MPSLVRAVFSRVINALAFVVVVIFGVAAGAALNVAEDVESEIKKRIDTQKPADRR